MWAGRSDVEREKKTNGLRKKREKKNEVASLYTGHVHQPRAPESIEFKVKSQNKTKDGEGRKGIFVGGAGGVPGCFEGRRIGR